MARTSLRLVSLPLLGFVVACATAVDQGFVDDDSGDDTGGSQSSHQGGLSSSAGQSMGNAGQTTGSGGKPPAAFGGTSSSGSGGMPSSAGAPAGGSSSGTAGKTGAGGNATAGTGSGGSSNGGSGTAGTSAGSGGKANGGAGGTSGSAGAGSGGKAGSGGTGSSAGSSSGGSGTGGSPSTGDCAPANSGWVVQYWTSTPAAELPGADLRIFNNAGGTVNFNTLELRHYFTNEDPSLSCIFSTFGHNFPGAPYYESEGGANVLSSIQNVSPALTNASHYISIKFNATPGNFGNGEDAQLGFYGSITMYPRQSNQANDYTYIGHPTNDPGSANRNTGWDHITLYAGGKLVWGCEP